MLFPHLQVTGANKGIGLAIVKRLCKELDGDVLLTGSTVAVRHAMTDDDSSLLVDALFTARDSKRGKSAEDELRQQGCHNVVFHSLDVTDSSSIDQLKKFIEQKYGGLDILVNNAGIMYGVSKKGQKTTSCCEFA